MGLKKRTYALPPEILDQFETQVPPGQRSSVVAGLMRGWLDRQHRKQLRRDIIEGCRQMAELYLEIEKEYHPLEEEVHRALDEPKARRRRARQSRSRSRL